MKTVELIQEVHAHGGRLFLEGDKVKLAPASLPAWLVREARAHREKLRHHLAQRPDPEDALAACGPRLRQLAQEDPALLEAVQDFLAAPRTAGER